MDAKRFMVTVINSGSIRMQGLGSSLLGFVIALIVSSIVIYVVSKLLWEREGFGTAILAAFIGTIIYTVMGFLIPGIIGSLLALVGWLLALRFLYHIGWLKAGLMALVIWIFAVIVSLILPTLPGPF